MKMFLVKRKILTAAVCLLLAAGMFYVVNHPAIVGAAAAARQLGISRTTLWRYLSKSEE